jgi:hypothetical protein
VIGAPHDGDDRPHDPQSFDYAAFLQSNSALLAPWVNWNSLNQRRRAAKHDPSRASYDVSRPGRVYFEREWWSDETVGDRLRSTFHDDHDLVERLEDIESETRAFQLKLWSDGREDGE